MSDQFVVGSDKLLPKALKTHRLVCNLSTIIVVKFDEDLYYVHGDPPLDDVIGKIPPGHMSCIGGLFCLIQGEWVVGDPVSMQEVYDVCSDLAHVTIHLLNVFGEDVTDEQ